MRRVQEMRLIDDDYALLFPTVADPLPIEPKLVLSTQLP